MPWRSEEQPTRPPTPMRSEEQQGLGSRDQRFEEQQVREDTPQRSEEQLLRHTTPTRSEEQRGHDPRDQRSEEQQAREATPGRSEEQPGESDAVRALGMGLSKLADALEANASRQPPPPPPPPGGTTLYQVEARPLSALTISWEQFIGHGPMRRAAARSAGGGKRTSSLSAGL